MRREHPGGPEESNFHATSGVVRTPREVGPLFVEETRYRREQSETLETMEDCPGLEGSSPGVMAFTRERSSTLLYLTSSLERRDDPRLLSIK